MKEVVKKVPLVILNTVKDLMEVAIGRRFFASLRKTATGKRTFFDSPRTEVQTFNP